MYKGFQEATYLPLDLNCETMKVRHGMNDALDESKEDGFRTLPLVSASAARKSDGSIILSLTNVSLDKAKQIEVSLDDTKVKSVSGRILTSKSVADYNDFEHPEKVKPVEFKDAKVKKGKLSVKVPAKSIIVLNIK